MRDEGAQPAGEAPSDDDLLRQCERFGIDTEYHDIWGERHVVSAASLRALLRETGHDAQSTSQKAYPALPPIVFLKEGTTSFTIGAWLPAEMSRIQWRLVEEDGEVHAGVMETGQFTRSEPHPVNGAMVALFDLSISVALPQGYHRLDVDGAPGDTLVVCAPQRCYEPPSLASQGRLWGIALQLYGLRSGRNWGIGDFTDLAAFAAQAASRGASVIGLNPLHALFPHNPSHASPYSPSSRAQLNVLYVDVEAVPDFQDCDEARTLVRSSAFQARLVALRAAPLVDYPGVAAAKHEVLALLHTRFLRRSENDPEVLAFRQFQLQGGDALHQHAVFEAVQSHLHQADPQVWGWPMWPQALREPSSAQLSRFIDDNAQRIAFFEYLQWQAARQLESVGAQCRAQGMSIGLYLDLAVSVDRGGSDTWRHQDTFALGASVGAPPDFHNRDGQDWGLPPLRPDRLRESRYAVFIEALRANMRGAGALRIDHVMMLMRLFWIPPGGKARDGAYLHYPYEDLFAILALESCRQRCLVVGEDLGTVPDAMREAMRRFGVLSYRLLYFEHDDAGNFRAPADFPRDAVVAVSTHDLPTLAGWWSGADLHSRLDLGLYAQADAFELQRNERDAERPRLLAALRQHVPQATDVPTETLLHERLTPGLAAAVHGYLAATPSSIVMVQLEDMLAQPWQANIPGTTVEHPNWQRKYTLDVQAMWRAPLTRQLSTTIARVRPRADSPAAALDDSRPRTRIPRATYRLQLHKGFTFDDAVRVVPYLAQLGISHVYCSPIHRARPGSMHGYDVVAHDEINSELGGMPAFERFTLALQAHGMGQLIDLVPNHMGVLGGDNPWWNDVLEKGMDSAYANHFDIDWHSATPGLAGKVLLPVLGDHYGEVLARGELRLQWDASVPRPLVQYFEHFFPVAAHTLPDALRHANADDPQAIANALAPFDGTEGRDALHALLEAQAYRLAYWRAAADEINYRRFFDVNELAALRTEREDVFEATHALALDLAARGWVEGLRIDHPDGLQDPAAYFERLQQGYASRVRAATWGFDTLDAAGRPLYVVAEKIASSNEDVPQSWAVHGTTGYRFANVANGVLLDHRAAERITDTWKAFTGNDQDFAQIVYEAKLNVARGTLASDLEVLATALLNIAKSDRRTRDHTLNTLRDVIAAVAASLGVYRTYNGDDATAQDKRLVAEAIDATRERLQLPDPSVFDFVQDALLGQAAPGAEPALQSAVRQFARRFQQYSAPVAAKGVEDTAFYRYFPLSSLNEVGGEPDRIGMTVEQFHEASDDRQRRWPQTMLASSTHDNKRSEDVRLRIDVLSEMPGMWEDALRGWKSLNAPLRGAVSATHEYLLYQTLLGTLPAGPMTADESQAYAQRIVQYMHKAAREGKIGTSWTRPEADYENALEQFIQGLLAPGQGNAFLQALQALAARLDRYGALNGLSLALLKFTSPGVPDIYQGCELIDRSLVDPDNRRAVDFDERQDALQSLQTLHDTQEVEGAVHTLVATATNGRAKLWTIWRLLALRSRLPAMLREGSYEPLEVLGARREHLLAFLRRHEGYALIVVVVRLFATFEKKHGAMSASSWKDTRVVLPADLDERLCEDQITTTRYKLAREIHAADVLGVYPGAVLVLATC
ncbi:malto-oligosyltrehalose synthase [Variovorax sp. J22R133]|uniref:malto-oligosyltrehalose synthase n=1 Tax=Variovorax brevis TaxID=3053503 RepID=UPI002577A99B|nr:malto-oligosyltrehalose synthase [Variovorax sp. J22R133]MDM0112502.1 malto-oligosyltrehalose synthase [Variovorax sp. J22R133]